MGGRYFWEPSFSQGLCDKLSFLMQPRVELSFKIRCGDRQVVWEFRTAWFRYGKLQPACKAQLEVPFAPTRHDGWWAHWGSAEEWRLPSYFWPWIREEDLPKHGMSSHILCCIYRLGREDKREPGNGLIGEKQRHQQCVGLWYFFFTFTFTFLTNSKSFFSPLSWLMAL